MAEEILVSMGKCPSCGEDWGMSEGEKKYFQDIIVKKKEEGKEFSMPTHCKKCRSSKKHKPSKSAEFLKTMIKKARDGNYDFDANALLEDLKQLQSMGNHG